MRLLSSIFLLMGASVAQADDTDVFTGGSISSASDVVMVLDTSGSMLEEETILRPAYESDTIYDNSKYNFEPDAYYIFRPKDLPFVLTDTNAVYIKENELKESQINCAEALRAAKSSGEYTGRTAYWYKGSSNGWIAPSGSNIDTYGEDYNNNFNINKNDNTGLVECPASEYFYNNNRYRYLRDSDDSPFTSSYWSRDGVFDQSIFSSYYDTHFSRLWRGNYLNYLSIEGSTDKKSRIDILKDATIDTIKSLASNVRVAIMRFDPYSEGGYVSVAMKSAQDNISSFETAIDSLNADGGTPITEALHEAQLYFTEEDLEYGYSSVSESRNGNTYVITQEDSCSKASKIIFFSDGIPDGDWSSDSYVRNLAQYANYDPDKYYLSKNCGDPYADTNGRYGGDCAEELAHYMYNDQDIVIDTIGGFTSASDAATQKLKDMAEAGGGNFYLANDYVEIKNALITAATETIITPNSFTAPTIAVNSYNSLKATDEIYYTVFQTNQSNGWRGNLKRYKLSSDGKVLAGITDVYDEENDEYSSDDSDYTDGEAIDPETGFFKDSARSFWSDRADGPTVEDGGMANRLTKNRNIFTNTIQTNTLVSISNEISLEGKVQGDNSHLSSNLRNNILPKSLLDSGDLSDDDQADIIEWIAGLKREQNENDQTVLVARKEMEDSLHSRPLIINYDDNTRVLFITSNSGYLHAFNIEWGEKESDRTAGEIFSFIPKEVLTNPFGYIQAKDSSDKIYGLDGQISFWHDDKDYDGIVDKQDGDQVYLYFGMRRGGSSYYALNVTDPKAPSIAWQIHGTYQNSDKNTPSMTSGFGQLGQTWSRLVPAEIKYKGNSEIVLIASGGYDEENDRTDSQTEDSYGNTLYVLDPKTGAILFDVKNDASEDITAKMNYSFITNPIVIDRDGNGYGDLIYIADLGGQVWRFDLNENATGKSNLMKGGIIASLTDSDSGDMRFFNDPDISYIEYKTSPYTAPVADEGSNESIDANGFIMISIGSGNRSDPLEEEVRNFHYIIRDNIGTNYPSEYNATSFEELSVWASENSAASEKGWKVPLFSKGEKVVSTSVTFFGEIFFTTYAPTQSGDNENSCTGDSGSSRVYALDVYKPTEDPIIENTGQSFMPGDPVITRLPSDDSLPDSEIESEYTVLVGTQEQAKRSPPVTVIRDYWKENPKPQANNNDEDEEEEDDPVEDDPSEVL